MNFHVMRLLGYKDFFRTGEPETKQFYAQQIGKEEIQRLCCLMLTYCKTGQTPDLLTLLQLWFTFKGKTYEQSISYGAVYDEYIRLVNTEGQNSHFLLSEESLLNLYIWASENREIPDIVKHTDGAFMIHLFMLMLLFNDDVLENYEKAKSSSERVESKVHMRRFFAERFPQNDLIDIDYGKLIYTQFFKLMELLNFLEQNEKYQKLYMHFLNDFGCNSKEEFFKALGGAVLIPFNFRKTGINSLVVEKGSEESKSLEFLDKLAFNPGDITLGPTDYKFLRDTPLQKLPDEYRVVFDFFLIKKLYNGITFKLSGYVNEDATLFRGPLFGGLRDDFSEGVLVYDTLENIFRTTANVVLIKGNDFKNAGVEREPDYYVRISNNIILFESKEFFMVAEDKLSYDFDTIVAGLRKDGRLGKAVLQSATNAARSISQSLKLDGGYNSEEVGIHPVIIVHDSLYNTAGLNYWVNEWFQEELSKIKNQEPYKELDFSRVREITLMDIDTLILYRKNFEKAELDLLQMIIEYQEYTEFQKVGETLNESMMRALMPFSDFVRHHAEKKNVKVDLGLINEIYKKSGFIDM